MSTLFQQVLHQIGIKQFKSTLFHPESQGALERFHQTLKSMMKNIILNMRNIGMKAFNFCSLHLEKLFKNRFHSVPMNLFSAIPLGDL